MGLGSGRASLGWRPSPRRDPSGSTNVIDTWLAEKVGRSDLSGVDLVRQAFSTDPPTEDRPRLRFADIDPATERWTNAHQGAMEYGVGCSMRIRNIITHDMAEPNPDEGLEALAALSLFARWIDEADRRTEGP
jgi:Protein of unknown function (Hypoth_ymh)